jgi:hypothetical protein
VDQREALIVQLQAVAALQAPQAGPQACAHQLPVQALQRRLAHGLVLTQRAEQAR